MPSLRNDIVLERVDGVWVLVALRPSWGECPFAMPTIPIYAEIWQMLRDGSDKEAAIGALTEKHALSREKAEKAFAAFVKAARKNHYLTGDVEEGPEARI